ncbi:MAG: sugar nucleotide-binding protein [Microgenomates group bacterium]
MSDKILIFGNGQIGHFYLDFFGKQGIESKIAVGVDITQKDQIEQVVAEYAPTVVINTAAKTSLEWCTLNRLETFNINVLGADNIAQVCDVNKIYFIHFSSGCIFESKDENDVKLETTIPNPAAFYSWSKVWAEQLIPCYKSADFKCLILRPRQPVSAQVSHKNMLIKLLTYTQFIDTANAGTVIEDLMNWTKILIEQRYTGVLHVANEGWSTPYRIAQLLQKHVLPSLPIEKITKAKLDTITPNKRVDTILNINKLKAIPGIVVESFEKRLEEIIIELATNLKTADKDLVNETLNSTAESSKQRAVTNDAWKTLLRQ